MLRFTQDGYGFLWLATTPGLYRYDGYSLKHYLHEPDDPASLSADRVWTVYKDRDGTLWIGTNGGLDRLDATRDTFTHYRHDPADERSLSGAVLVIYQDRGGTSVGRHDGRARQDGPGANGFIHYRHDPRNEATLSNNGSFPLHEDRRGNLWIGTNEGLNVLEKATGRISRFKHDPADPHSLGHDYVSSRSTRTPPVAVGRLLLRQRVERPGREDRAVHALFLSRRKCRARRPHRSERALRGPRRSPLAGHMDRGLAEARPRAHAVRSVSP